MASGKLLGKITRECSEPRDYVTITQADAIKYCVNDNIGIAVTGGTDCTRGAILSTVRVSLASTRSQVTLIQTITDFLSDSTGTIQGGINAGAKAANEVGMPTTAAAGETVAPFPKFIIATFTVPKNNVTCILPGADVSGAYHVCSHLVFTGGLNSGLQASINTLMGTIGRCPLQIDDESTFTISAESPVFLFEYDFQDTVLQRLKTFVARSPVNMPGANACESISTFNSAEKCANVIGSGEQTACMIESTSEVKDLDPKSNYMIVSNGEYTTSYIQDAEIRNTVLKFAAMQSSTGNDVDTMTTVTAAAAATASDDDEGRQIHLPLSAYICKLLHPNASQCF